MRKITCTPPSHPFFQLQISSAGTEHLTLSKETDAKDSKMYLQKGWVGTFYQRMREICWEGKEKEDTQQKFQAGLMQNK